MEKRQCVALMTFRSDTMALVVASNGLNPNGFEGYLCTEWKGKAFRLMSSALSLLDVFCISPLVIVISMISVPVECPACSRTPEEFPLSF